MSLRAFLDKTVTLKRQALTKDAIGGSSRTYPTTVATFPAAIWPARSDVARTFARRDLVGDTVIVSDADRGAKASDVVEYAGQIYVVHGAQPFNNAVCGALTVYVIDATLRTT